MVISRVEGKVVCGEKTDFLGCPHSENDDKNTINCRQTRYLTNV